MRKTYTGEFKARVVLEILREEKSISEISARHGIHSNQLGKWKKEALAKLPEIFEDGRRKGDKEKEALKEQIQDLYTEIGRLSTQNSWLKKKSGINIE